MGKRKEKIPPPGSKKEKSTAFFSRKKWISIMQNTLLELSGRMLNPRGALVVANALARNNYVVRLDLCNNDLGDEGALAIADLLRVNQHLQLLNLSQNHITDIGGIAIASSFVPSVSPSGAPGQWNRSLFTLIMAGNELGDDTLLALSNATVCHRDLTRVDLSWNHIGPQGTKCLLRSFQRNPLVNFILAANEIGDEGTVHLCDAMRRYGGRSQTTLNLFMNNITHRGAEAVGKLLEGNETLLDINLSGNSLGQKGMQALKESLLKAPSNLCLLNVSDNLLGDEGAKEIAEIIEGDLPNLIRLDCSDNNITDKGATFIAKALRSNHGLQMLDCQNNVFGPKSVAIVEEMLRQTKTLKSINLSDCIASSETRRHLTLAVGEAEGVHVELGSAGIGEEEAFDPPKKIEEYLQMLADQEAQRMEELKKAGKLNKKTKKKK